MMELLTQALGILLALAATSYAAMALIGWCLRFAPRDPVRIFTADQKRYLMRQAGGRCEHRPLLWFRCHRTRRLQADHIMPWSRGGRTIITNGQMLCAIHNRRKTNRIPSPLYGMRIQLRRRRGRHSSTPRARTFTITGRSVARSGGRTRSTLSR